VGLACADFSGVQMRFYVDQTEMSDAKGGTRHVPVMVRLVRLHRF